MSTRFQNQMKGVMARKRSRTLSFALFDRENSLKIRHIKHLELLRFAHDSPYFKQESEYTIHSEKLNLVDLFKESAFLKRSIPRP
ncbi:MAG: hypothetical protein AB7F86_05825 [Bdellovibrionales bacterium]